MGIITYQEQQERDTLMDFFMVFLLAQMTMLAEIQVAGYPYAMLCAVGLPTLAYSVFPSLPRPKLSCVVWTCAAILAYSASSFLWPYLSNETVLSYLIFQVGIIVWSQTI